MNKVILSAMAAMLSFTASAQKTGDKITINTSESGKQAEWNLAGEQNAISSIRHTADGKNMEVYLKGLEDFGAWETYDIDKISSVIFSVDRGASPVGNVKLADAAANDAVKRLYKYLQLNYGSKILSSVIADVNWNHSNADHVYSVTGKYPAINCYDFIHIYVSKQGGWINYDNITPVTEWADAGGLVSLMWHFNVPLSEQTQIGSDGSGVTCSPDKTTFKAKNALLEGTWENKWFYGQMDKVADVLLKLQDAGVSAIWRPFHEAAGNATRNKGDWKGEAWFWWGYDGAETYKSLWKAMFNYFQSKGIHNLIWQWTTQNYNGDASSYQNDSEWYPGDAYVDIIGRDLYGYDAAKQKQEFQEIQARYPEKMIALAECGTDVNSGSATADIAAAWNAGARWGMFMPWYGSNMPSDAWWKAVMGESCVVTRGQVNVNATMVSESAVNAVANMGVGFNLGNTLDAWNMSLDADKNGVSDFETTWGQKVTTRAMVDFLKRGGIKSVRIPVTWFQHMDEQGQVDAAWMDRVQEVVDYVIDNGMYCILNVHHDTGEDNAGSGFTSWIKADKDNYQTHHGRFENLWTQIATRFRDYDQRLLFEGYNEMLDANNQWNEPKDASSYEALNSYAQSFVDAVRATGGNNTYRNLIISTYAAAKDAALDALVLPSDKVDGHLAVEVHSYDPWDWFAQKGAWDASCSETLKNIMAQLNKKFVSKGIPVIIGEYGTNGSQTVSKNSTDSQKQAAADQAADMIRQAKTYGIATYYWMGIFDGADRANLQWTLPTVVDAMIKAYCE